MIETIFDWLKGHPVIFLVVMVLGALAWVSEQFSTMFFSRSLFGAVNLWRLGRKQRRMERENAELSAMQDEARK